MKYEKYVNGGWAVYDDKDLLVCVTMYKRGAAEVIRRLKDYSTEPVGTQMDAVQQEIKLLSKELRQANKRLQSLIKKCCTE